MNKSEKQGALILFGLIASIWIGFTIAWWAGLLIIFSVLGYFGSKIETDSVPAKKRNPFATTKKPPTTYEDKKEVMAIPCDIEDCGDFDFEIVGESHYQEEINLNVPLSYRLIDKFRLYAIAALYQDDDNEYDEKAVAVQLEGDTVGHLDRTDARRYRKWADKNAMRNPASCRAVIIRNKGSYGIWLDLPISNAD